MKNGILDSFFTTLQNNPSAAAGSCTFAVAFALVAGNAFYSQPGSHPDPIWATRDHTITQSIAPQVKSVKLLAVQPKSIPTPASGDSARQKIYSGPQKSELIEAVQKALVQTGDFKSAIDGLNGPVTRSAIMAYQARHALEQTGEASRSLLDSILQDSPEIVSAAPKKSIASLVEDSSATSQYDPALVQMIQKGITNVGVANIEADGIFGKQTEAAIMDFQRRNKLAVTGRPEPTVLQKLINLGALSQG